MTEIDHEQLIDQVEAIMNAAWREPGFCVPNQETYPHQWLWDSCFHALVWSSLGSDRGVAEVENVLANQAVDGFVPHMTYWTKPDFHADYWGRPGASSITQPPMYGHAIVELVKADYAVTPDLVEQAVRGLLHLAARPRTEGNLIPVFHPWETGCDDSARWDGWIDRSGVDSAAVQSLLTGPEHAELRQATWREQKNGYVADLVLSEFGHAINSTGFVVGSVGFNALVSFNARELAFINGPWQEPLHDLADELDDAVAKRWNGEGWTDDGGPDGSDSVDSNTIRTLDAALPLLVDPRPNVFDSIIDTAGFGAPFGPRGVHLGEPSYDPDRYWRGPSWPQLTYLIMIAAERAGEEAIAASVAKSLVGGASVSGLSEYWNPETGEGFGARPQTWAGIAICALSRIDRA